MNLIRETFFNSLEEISKLFPTMPKIFTIWLLIEKDCRLLLYRHFKIKRYTTCWLQKEIIEIDKENILNKILIFCETYVAYYSASLNNTNLKSLKTYIKVLINLNRFNSKYLMFFCFYCYIHLTFCLFVANIL